MKLIKCFTINKLKEIIPFGYELKHVMHIFQGDIMGQSTFEYYFVKPEVDKLYTDMDYSSDKVDLIFNDGSKIDLSCHAIRKQFGEFRINEFISPPLNIRDDYIESTLALDCWLFKIFNVDLETLNNHTVTIEVAEDIVYDRISDLFATEGCMLTTLQLSDKEVDTIINCVSDDNLKAKIKTILLSRRWKRIETGYKIKD